LRLLPPICHRMVIRRIRGQRIRGEPRAVGRQQWLSRRARGLPCSRMHATQGRRALGHAQGQERLGTVRGEAALKTLGPQAPGASVTRLQHLGALPLVTGFDRGRLAPARPGVTHRAPLRTAGCLRQQDAALPTRGVEMRRHNAGLGARHPQGGQQCPPIRTVVTPTALAPEQHPAEDRRPTGRLTAHDARTCVKQRHAALRLAGGPLRAPPSASRSRTRGMHIPGVRGLERSLGCERKWRDGSTGANITVG
jgi:hypothetical protein